MSTVVVKIGTSSISNERGTLDDATISRIAADLADARDAGNKVVLVASGAVAAGMPALGFEKRPTELGTLQATAAVGQPLLIARLSAALAKFDITVGQVLLTPNDFGLRNQYLHARETLRRLLDFDVLPIVNENDTVASGSIRYGDNDRIAALCAHLVQADLLLLLTDTPGLFTADPRIDSQASLIEEVAQVDKALEALAGDAGTERGSGGMASKVAAAKIAAWSGIETIIAGASSDRVVARACMGEAIGTVLKARSEQLSSRKLWIAFARGAAGQIVIDNGARKALVELGRSLLAAGVREVDGSFEDGDAIEVLDINGDLVAKGITRYSTADLRASVGRRTSDLQAGLPTEVIHRDDLVVLV